MDHDIAYFFVAEEPGTGEILGYILFWIIEETMELHDIAVKKNRENKGLGSRLMEFMLGQAGSKGVREIFLEVRESNRAAIRLYDKFRFKKIDTRKDYFNQPREDALIYALYLP